MDHLFTGTLAEAVEALAKRAAYLRTAPAEKTAAGFSDFLASAGDTLKNNPTLSHALVGGGLGAAATGLGTAYSNAGRDPSERKSILGSALTGGLMGAGVGGGIGLARSSYGKISPDQITGTDAMPRGEYEAGGKRMAIDPKALKQNPGLAAQARALTEPQDPTKAMAGKFMGGLGYLAGSALPFGQTIMDATGVTDSNNPNWLAKTLPFSTAALPKLGLIDALAHSGLNTGERFGVGRIRPEFSNDPNHLRMGLKDVKDPGAAVKSILNNSRNDPSLWRAFGMGDTPQVAGDNSTRSVSEILGRNRAGGPADHASGWWTRLRRAMTGGGFRNANRGDVADTVLTKSETPTLKVKKFTNDAAGNRLSETEYDQPGKPKTDTMTRGQVRSAKRDGFMAEGKDLKREDSYLYRLGSKQWRPASLAKHVSYRIPLYGGIPLAEYAIRGQMEEAAKRKSLSELMGQHSHEAQ